MKPRSLKLTVLALTFTALASVLHAGCVPTLHPIYTAGDVVFDQALLGLWRDAESPTETWAFAAASGKAYRLVFTESDGTAGAFVVHLARIGGATFLDLYPEPPERSMNALYADHLVPAHTFLLVERLGPELRLRAPEPEWVSGYLERHPDALAHEVLADRTVITASTEALQRFVLAHLETEGAFGHLAVLERAE